MALKSGTLLGPYEVVDAIGAGGMGEVYRAMDTRLRREIAVKILPEEFSQDRDRHPEIRERSARQRSTVTP
jgi:serine/threonine protein kinase